MGADWPYQCNYCHGEGSFPQHHDACVVLAEAVMVTEPPRLEGLDPADRMIFLNGSERSFRCSCGGNVFKQVTGQPNRFACNGCNARYTGE